MTILTYVSMGYGIGIIPQTMTRMDIPNVVFREIATSLVPKSAIAFVYRRNGSSPQTDLLDQTHAQPCAAALTADLRIRYSLTPVIVRQMRDA